MWITNGGFADVYIVFAKVGGEKLSAFIVERSYPGFKPGNEEHKMGIHGSSTTPIFLENCKVPKENLLHEIGRGHIVAFNILNAGRFTLGASAVGGSKYVLMTAAKYAKERKAFGKAIGDFGLGAGKAGGDGDSAVRGGVDDLSLGGKHGDGHGRGVQQRRRRG